MSLDRPVRRVLVATDFSSTAAIALDWAAALARSEKAELHVVHVWQPDASMPDDAAAELELECAASVEKICRGRDVAGRWVKRGSADAEIASLAVELGVDRVVMGTHGRSGLSHVLLGSVAERVIRLSPIPVVTVPASWATHGPIAGEVVRKVLCPTDLSGVSELAVAAVLVMAERIGAELVLLHVLDLPPYALRNDDVLVDIQRTARRDLEELAERHRTRRVGVSTQVRVGLSGDTIVGVARELDVDLIALATHGRRGVGRFFLGSVAERVARTAGRPVLTIRMEGAS